MPKFLDLFAGAGGLSEGFIQAGYTPIAHVEMDVAACYTLKTRVAYHWLKANGNLEVYHQYLRGEIKRDEFYAHIPEKVLNSVLNYEISSDTIPEIFEKVDHLLDGEKLDLIIGGPPLPSLLSGWALQIRDKNGGGQEKLPVQTLCGVSP